MIRMVRIEKSQPTSSSVHVPTAGTEKKINKKHDRSNLHELKAALLTLTSALEKFLSEEELEKSSEVEKIDSGDEDRKSTLPNPSAASSVVAQPKAPADSTGPATAGSDLQPQQEIDATLYKDPDTNPDMYPDLDNLEAAVLKEALGETNFPDDSDTNDYSELYGMQELINGIDYELANAVTDKEVARGLAESNLELDPNYYRKKVMEDNSTDDQLAKDTEQTEDDPFAGEGFCLDLGSGSFREPGHIGIDTYPYDEGTYVHDLNMGIPLPDQSVKKVQMRNAFHDMDLEDPKALLSEIHRVLMPGGQFVYEGPNEIYNYPEWAQDYPGFVLVNHEDNLGNDDQNLENSQVNKSASGKTITELNPLPIVRQSFTRIAQPDPATANDAEPRVGVSQYDQLPADALLAMDAVGYSWSDATSSGRGNRLMGYPSQGSLLNKGEDEPKKPKMDLEKGGPGSGPQPGSGDKLKEAKQKLEAARKEETEAKKYKAAAPREDRDHADNVVRQATLARQHHEDAVRYHENNIKNAPPPRQQQRQPEMVQHSIEKILKSGRVVPILKADKYKQIVYGVILEPGSVDGQDDWMEPEEIEKAAHRYLLNSRVIGSEHSNPIHARPVESFIAPQDFEANGQYGPQAVKKGSWVLGAYIEDPKEWQKVLDGEYTGFSVGGMGLRDHT